jgi:glycosyltransferase involved in cell wall biosynthesis
VAGPLVSFIIPVLNGERTIREAVDSCLRQTHTDIEVVITDDGSTDGTLEMLRAAYGGDSRVKIHSLERHRGKVAAYNHCFSHATGEFIAVLDADDIAVDDRIRLSLEAIEHTGAELVCGDGTTFGEGIEARSVARNLFGRHGPVSLDFNTLLKRPQVLGPTILVKREACKTIFPMDERMSHQDWWMALAAAYRRPVEYIDTPLVKYRLHDSNTSRINPRQSFDRWLDITTREIFYYRSILVKFSLKHDQEVFCHCRIRMYELLRQSNPFRRWARGLAGLWLLIGPGIPWRERMKYLLAALSPGLAYRISIAAARRARR